MKNIVLLCNMGMSTSALMKKMRTYAQSIGMECEINAYPIAEAPQVGPKADCILVGPQVSYQVDRVKEQVPGVPVEAIAMKDYGMMDGAKVIAQAKRLMGM